MKYNEVETSRLLKDFNNDSHYIIVNKGKDTFDYYVYYRSTLIFRTNTNSALWNKQDYKWHTLQYVENRKIKHLMINQLFKKIILR